MKPLALTLCLVASAALAQSAEPAAGSLTLQNAGATVGRVSKLNCTGTGVTCSRSGKTGTLSFSGGGLAEPVTLTQLLTLSSNGGTTASTTNQVRSGVADGASAIAVTVKSDNALANAAAKLLSISNSTTEKANINKDGALTVSGVASGSNALVIPQGARLNWAGATGAGYLSGDNFGLNVNTQLSAPSFNIGSNGTLALSSFVITKDLGSFTLGIQGYANSTAGQNTALKIGNVNSLTLAGSKLVAFYSNAFTTEAANIDRDGSYHFKATATLRTCDSTTEGLLSRDAVAGGTTGNRTKLCLCTSDGAATPAYAWQNLAAATVGTTTTCP